MEWRIENKDTFYPVLLNWWKQHEFTPIDYKSLPINIFVAYRGEVDICAIPVYQSDSDFCYLGFITINKESKLRDKATVVPFLIDKVEMMMKERGYSRILITCNVSGLMKSLEKSGLNFIEQTNYFLKNI